MRVSEAKQGICYNMVTRLREANNNKPQQKTKVRMFKMKKDYKVVDEVKMTVTVSKDFLKKAGQFGTPEFIEALEMRKEGFTILERKIKKNPDKQTYADLTYDKMKSVIEGYWTDKEEREAKLEEFEYVKKWAKTQPASYAKVKSWFKKNYGKYYEEVEAKAKEAKAKAQEEKAKAKAEKK